MSDLIGSLKRVIRDLNTFSVILGSVMVVLMMLGISIAAVSRYLFHQALGWVDDFSGLSMVFLALLGAGEVMRRHGHVHIDLFVGMFKTRKRLVMAIGTSAVGMVVSLLLIWYGAGTTVHSYQQHAVTNSTLYPLPEALFFWVIPLSGFLLAVYFLRDIKDNLRLLKDGEDTLE